MARLVYHAYVDASGDDGNRFGSGSTRTYAVAALVMAAEDVADNTATLEQAKRIAKIPAKNELKYSSLTHIATKPKVVEKLAEMKGFMIGLVALKSRYDQVSFASLRANKALSALVHALPVGAIPDYVPQGTDLQIFVDRCKKPEEDAIPQAIGDLMTNRHLAARKTVTGDTHNVTFGDSKRVKLIQAADVFAGIMREYFDWYDTQQWYPCHLCRRGRSLCADSRKQKNPPRSGLFAAILPLFSESPNGWTTVHGIMYLPAELCPRMLFVDCLIKHNGPPRQK